MNIGLNKFWSIASLPNLRVCFFMGVSVLASSCAAPPASVAQRPNAPSAAVAFDAAIDYAVDDILVQAQRLPEFQPPTKNAVEAALNREAPPRKKIVVDASLDGVSGQQTMATRFLDTRLLARAAAGFPQFEVTTLSSEKAAFVGRFLLASTVTPIGEVSSKKQARFRVNLSLTDLQTGYVLAQSAVQTTELGVDMTPTKFYQDSPSITRDRVVEGQVRTAQAKAGSEADGIYVSSLTVSALIKEGSQFYDAGQFEQSLRAYEAAAARPDGKQLRVFNGLYLNNMQLGRSEAAENAFGRIVSLGLATNSLAVKFLFKAGSTDFLADSKITTPYPMWLNVLAKEMGNAQLCVSVIGHSSHTGTENVNDRLSLARASAVQRRLESILPSLSSRLQPLGMGYRENLIGTGSDDLRDSLDRRVEFRAINCLR